MIPRAEGFELPDVGPLLAAPAHPEMHRSPVRLDGDLLALLDYRRSLDDLPDRASRIMGKDLPQEHWEADLEGVAWYLGRWDELDERAARIRAILAGPG